MMATEGLAHLAAPDSFSPAVLGWGMPAFATLISLVTSDALDAAAPPVLFGRLSKGVTLASETCDKPAHGNQAA